MHATFEPLSGVCLPWLKSLDCPLRVVVFGSEFSFLCDLSLSFYFVVGLTQLSGSEVLYVVFLPQLVFSCNHEPDRTVVPCNDPERDCADAANVNLLVAGSNYAH